MDTFNKFYFTVYFSFSYKNRLFIIGYLLVLGQYLFCIKMTLNKVYYYKHCIYLYMYKFYILATIVPMSMNT